MSQRSVILFLKLAPMNLLKTIPLLVILATMFACSESTDPAEVPDTRDSCHCEDLIVDMHYNRSHIYDTETYFTGKCSVLWDGTNQLKEERQYEEGKITGYVRTWHQNGNMKAEKWFRNNLQHGVASEWNEAGELTYKARYSNGDMKERLPLEPDSISNN